MLNENDFTEPLKFFYSKNFLSGCSDIDILKNYNFASSFEEAENLRFEQLLSNDFFIWSDFYELLLSNTIEKLSTSQYQDVANVVSDKMKEIGKGYVKDRIKERKDFLTKKRNNLLTEHDINREKIIESFSLDCQGDLEMIAINRLLYGNSIDIFWEKIFKIYKNGLIPCGIKKSGEIIVFNPK